MTIASDLIVLFNKTKSLTDSLDKNNRYIMVFSVYGTDQYSLETYLQVSPKRNPDDSALHAVDDSALTVNYTGVELVDRFKDKPMLDLELGRLRRFDVASHQTQLWFGYSDGTFTHLTKGVVYVAVDQLQTHSAKVTSAGQGSDFYITLSPMASDRWQAPELSDSRGAVAKRRKKQLMQAGTQQ
jgi:hypothetical protein